MKWLELSVDAPPEFVEPLSQLFHRYGDGGVALELQGGHLPDEGEVPVGTRRVKVVTYVLQDSKSAERLSRIDIGVRLVAHVAPISTLVQREIEQEDWENAWKKHFEVLRVGRRVVVKPAWRSYKATSDDIVVELDPGMAFGTGHHPTTRTCIEVLEETVRSGDRVLDVGSGSGILTIAAAKLGASKVIGLEVDPDSVRAAEANLLGNGVSVIACVVEGTLPHPSVESRAFDLAVANISAKVNSSIASDLVAATKPGGTLIASGMLESTAGDVADELRAQGAEVQRTVVVEGWVTMLARAPMTRG